MRRRRPCATPNANASTSSATASARHRRTGRRYLGASPSKKSVLRLKAKVHDVLAPANVAPWPVVCQRLNALLKGWSAHFSYGSVTEARRAIDGYVCARVQQFLARRHKLTARGYSRFPWRIVFGELGVFRMRQHPAPLPLFSNQSRRRAGCGRSARPVR